MKYSIIRSTAVLMCVGLLSTSFAGEPLTVTGVLFVNSARIIQDPVLPITIDGLTPVAGHPWYEPRISAGTQPPPALPASIEVISQIAPSNFLRPPGRIIPSPYDEATFSFSPIDKQTFDYLSRWPELFTPRDGRNTVVLALVNRARSLLFNTNFDLDYSLDQEIIQERTGLQTTMIRLTPRVENETIVIRLRAEATDDADSQFVDGSAIPAPSFQTPTSVIWGVGNPAVGETLTFTVQGQVSNFAAPTPVRHIPALVITSSFASKLVGDAVGDAVSFPAESLPIGIDAVNFSLGQSATWAFLRSDRTLVDIREVTDLVP